YSGAATSDATSAADDADVQEPAGGAIVANAGPAPSSTADAAQALAAIADYYSQSEPSSPLLPLVRQAHQLIGKSFLQVITILMPSHGDKAAFQIGSDQVFELPVERLSDLSRVSPAPSSDSDSTAAAPADQSASSLQQYRIKSRAEALALLDMVQRYFRV